MRNFVKPSTILPNNLDEVKTMLVYDRSDLGNKSSKNTSYIGSVSDSVSMGYPKMIDAYKVGYGPDAYTEVRETDIKVGLEKVRKTKIMEHRSQNKNLLVPSGRKEV